MEKLNLYEKIQAVTADIKAVEKKLEVGGGKYKYNAVADADVLSAVRRAEKKNKLLSMMIGQECLESFNFLNDNNKMVFVDKLKTTTRIIDLENTADYIDITTHATGLDTGDKGFGKASTYARKYALLNAYKIITGEDPDKDKPDEITPINESEKKTRVKNVFTEYPERGKNVLQHFGVESVDDLEEEAINKIIKALRKEGLWDV